MNDLICRDCAPMRIMLVILALGILGIGLSFSGLLVGLIP
jgi:hypothetical protein